jgi:uncharacterized protein with PIN domain
MSDYTNEIIKCPNCGNSIEGTLWNSINAQINPEARNALLHNRIHLFDCKVCKKKFRIDKSILYHDMARGFFVWYFPLKA